MNHIIHQRFIGVEVLKSGEGGKKISILCHEETSGEICLLFSVLPRNNLPCEFVISGLKQSEQILIDK